MQTQNLENESLSTTQNIIDEIEHGEILKRDEKSLKAKEFLNVLTDMILSYSHLLAKKSA